MENARDGDGEGRRGNKGPPTGPVLLGFSFPDCTISQEDWTSGGAAWDGKVGPNCRPLLPCPPPPPHHRLCVPRISWSPRPLRLGPAGLP